MENVSLRERKYAALKLRILDTFDKKLHGKSLSDITVKEVALELEISEKTFFNYFAHKHDVLIYFIELWSLEMQLLIEGVPPREALYRIFDRTAEMIGRNRQLFMEIVSSIALHGVPPKEIPITRAEKILRFGTDMEYQEGGFSELIIPLLRQMDIPKERHLSLYISLYNTCFATPLLMNMPEFGSLSDRYHEQINGILRGGM